MQELRLSTVLLGAFSGVAVSSPHYLIPTASVRLKPRTATSTARKPSDFILIFHFDCSFKC